jgi:hypothetical protein
MLGDIPVKDNGFKNLSVSPKEIFPVCIATVKLA